MANTRGRTNYKPVNYRAGMAELRESQAGVVSSLKQEKADTRYRSKEKTAEQQRMSHILTSGISGISNAMRVKKLDDQAKKVTDSNLVTAKQKQEEHLATSDSRISTANEQAKALKMANDTTVKNRERTRGMESEAIANFKGEFPDDVQSEEAKANYVASTKREEDRQLGIRDKESIIKTREDSLAFQKDSLAYKKGLALDKQKKKDEKSNPDNPAAMLSRHEKVRANPTESHIPTELDRSEKSRYASRLAIHGKMNKEVQGHEKGQRALMNISSILETDKFIQPDGTLSEEGRAISSRYVGAKGKLLEISGTPEEKQKIGEIKAEIQTFLVAAAEAGTFGALNFPSEIKKALAEAGIAEVGPDMNMESAAAAIFGTEVGVSILFARQATKGKNQRDEMKQYFNTADTGNMNHREMSEWSEALAPLGKKIKSNDAYVDFEALSHDKSKKSGQAAIDAAYGVDTFKLGGRFSEYLDMENYSASDEADIRMGDRLAEYEDSESYSKFMNSHRYKDWRNRKQKMYADRPIQQDGVVRSQNGIGQSIDASTGSKNALTTMDPNTQATVVVNSPSGTITLGATAVTLDPYQKQKKADAKLYMYESAEVMDSEINDVFGSEVEINDGSMFDILGSSTAIAKP